MQNRQMSDKEYMEDLLMTSKTLNGLYHYATTEASTEPIRKAFKCNLSDSIEMQHNIYAAMQQNGWYPQQQAQPQQINQVRTKYQVSM
ncbi:MAG: spore coat protein [Oscillospiraceae bacterium]|nr:spore coat protein [Oscillospiraceae bacterium]